MGVYIVGSSISKWTWVYIVASSVLISVLLCYCGQLADGQCVQLTTALVLLKDSHCLAFCLKVLRALIVRSQCFEAAEVRKG